MLQILQDGHEAFLRFGRLDCDWLDVGEYGSLAAGILNEEDDPQHGHGVTAKSGTPDAQMAAVFQDVAAGQTSNRSRQNVRSYQEGDP